MKLLKKLTVVTAIAIVFIGSTHASNVISDAQHTVFNDVTVTASPNYAICTGVDGGGRYHSVTIYNHDQFIDRDGQRYQISGPTRNGQGVVTQTFVATNGILMYDSYVPAGTNKLSFYQFNAVTEQLLGYSLLSCNFYGIKSANTSIFTSEVFSILNSKPINKDEIKDMPFNRVAK